MGGWLLPETWGDDWSGTAGVPPQPGEAASRMASYLTVSLTYSCLVDPIVKFCHLNRSSVWRSHLKYFYPCLSSTALFISSSVTGNTFFFLATQVNGSNSAPCLDALRPDVLTPASLSSNSPTSRQPNHLP